MANHKRDNNKIAEIIICANLRGDEAACREHNIKLRTLQHYRKLATEDGNLAQICATKRTEVADQLQGENWVMVISDSLLQGAKKFSEWISSLGSRPNNDDIKTLIGGMKIMGELKLQTEIIGDDASDTKSNVVEKDG